MPLKIFGHIASVGLVASSLGFASNSIAQPLELNTYLGQVESRNTTIVASKKTMEASRLKSDEGSLAFAPNVFASYTHIDDKSPAGNQATQSADAITDIGTVGVKQMFRTGTAATVSYNVSSFKFEDANPRVLPVNEFSTGKPTVEIRQSLWRNLAAKELKAAEEMLSAKSDAGFYGERYKMRASLLDAEMTYWKLSFAREVVRISQDNLTRAKKIQDWTSARVNRQLADKADLMQAEATTGLRTLDLQSAKDDERVAARAFNSLRGTDSDAVPENLAEYRVELAWRTGLPARANQRDDVAAAQAAVKAAVAGAEATEQKYKPSLDVFGSYSLNSMDADKSDAMKDSFKRDKPTLNMGVTFSMPIGASAIKRTTDGYRLDAMAAQQSADRKAFEQEQEWRTLTTKLDDAKRRLQLSASIETLQKTKLENERDRHMRGRSTLYQVLMFEQEYEAARLGKLGRLTEVLALAAQMKMYSPRAN